jgi:hypothetical protein
VSTIILEPVTQTGVATICVNLAALSEQKLEVILLRLVLTFMHPFPTVVMAYTTNKLSYSDLFN